MRMPGEGGNAGQYCGLLVSVEALQVSVTGYRSHSSANDTYVQVLSYLSKLLQQAELQVATSDRITAFQRGFKLEEAL
jgi:hypothetical protein